MLANWHLDILAFRYSDIWTFRHPGNNYRLERLQCLTAAIVARRDSAIAEVAPSIVGATAMFVAAHARNASSPTRG